MFPNVLRRRTGSADRAIALEVLQSFIAAVAHSDPDPNIEHVLEQLQQHVNALRDHTPGETAPELLDAITTSCASALAVGQRHQDTRRQDVAAFLATVRESVHALTAQADSCSNGLATSLARLEAAGQYQDITELQQLVLQETTEIRRRVAEHESEQRAIAAALAHRVTLREEQLSLSSDDVFIDPLTRLANRRGFDVALGTRLQQVDPTTPVVLALFDVDALRTVNKELGQCAGDAVLRHVAGTIRQAVRSQDIVARIGGDEFAVVASGLSLLRAQARLRQVLRAIADGSMTLGGDPISVTCGAAELSAGDSVPTLLHRADAALQEAKQRVRGSVITRMAPSIRSQLHPALYGKTA